MFHGGPVGILANPASGKDVRRLMARASVFDNREKSAIVRRVLIGAFQAGSRDIMYLPDSHNIVAAAIDEVDASCKFTPVGITITATARDTELAAVEMKKAGCAVVLTLGGDGTNRAFARGWPDAPLIALSTGTNNVFPVFAEATTAGAAAGLIGSGCVSSEEVSRPCKIVRAEIRDEERDIALIDVVSSNDRFTGAGALIDGEALKSAILTRAEPNAVGISALGGLLQPLSDMDDGGIYLSFGTGELNVNAPLAPGLYQRVTVAEVRAIAFDEWVEMQGPCMLAFDGERETVMHPGEQARFSISRSGPAVVDIAKALQLGASRGAFRQ